MIFVCSFPRKGTPVPSGELVMAFTLTHESIPLILISSKSEFLLFLFAGGDPKPLLFYYTLFGVIVGFVQPLKHGDGL